VHIGPHKTGSSYTQKMLHDEESYLRSHGFLLIRGWHSKGLANFAFTLKSQVNQTVAIVNPERRLIDVKAFREITALVDNTHSSIIMSSEEFDDLDFPAATLLRSILHKYDVTIVYFHRERTHLLRSNYFQRTRSKRTPCPIPFEEFLAEHRASRFSGIPGVELNHTLTVFTSVFGSDAMRVISYDGVMDQGLDLFDVFLQDVLGIQTPKYRSSPTINGSPSSESLDVKAFMCSHNVTSDESVPESMECSELRDLGMHFQRSEKAIFERLNLRLLYPPSSNMTFATVCRAVTPSAGTSEITNSSRLISIEPFLAFNQQGRKGRASIRGNPRGAIQRGHGNAIPRGISLEEEDGVYPTALRMREDNDSMWRIASMAQHTIRMQHRNMGKNTRGTNWNIGRRITPLG
jgi:hypothetical protein